MGWWKLIPWSLNGNFLCLFFFWQTVYPEATATKQPLFAEVAKAEEWLWDFSSLYEAKLYFWPAHNRICVRVNEVQLWVTKLTQWGAFISQLDLSVSPATITEFDEKQTNQIYCVIAEDYCYSSMAPCWLADSHSPAKKEKVPILFASISVSIPAHTQVLTHWRRDQELLASVSKVQRNPKVLLWTCRIFRPDKVRCVAMVMWKILINIFIVLSLHYVL